jgi:hypothetical protein
MGLDYYLEVFNGCKLDGTKFDFDNVDDLDGLICEQFPNDGELITVIQNGCENNYSYYLAISKKYNSYSYRGRGNEFTPNITDMELDDDEIAILYKIYEWVCGDDNQMLLYFYILTDYSC